MKEKKDEKRAHSGNRNAAAAGASDVAAGAVASEEVSHVL
jgi:hypothetical protein